MPKPNGYVLNYVILTTHSSHLYSMWDFTHTFASLWASRSLCEPWTSPTHSSLPNGIFTSSARHPWVSCTPSMRITCQPRMHIHGNLAPHHYLALLAIFLCWAFFFFSPFSRIFVCGPFRFSLSLLGGDHEHLTTFTVHHQPSSNTTCWGDKYLGEFPWVINITYRDTV